MSTGASSLSHAWRDGGTQSAAHIGVGAPSKRNRRRGKESSCWAAAFHLQGALRQVRRTWEGSFNDNNHGDKFTQFTSSFRPRTLESHEDELRSHLDDWHVRQEATVAHAAHVWEALQVTTHHQQKATIPRIGLLPSPRPPGVWRWMYCQVNGLAEPSRRRQKIADMMDISRRFDVDGIALCEVGVNLGFWGQHQRLGDWFNRMAEREVRASGSFNVNGPKLRLGQQGGMALVLNHGLLQYARQTAHDFRRLGRWASWVPWINPEHRTRIVVSYCPGRARKDGTKTVYQQHLRYIQHNCLNCSPYNLFVDDLC